MSIVSKMWNIENKYLDDHCHKV